MEKRVNMQLSYVYVNIHNTVMNIVEMEKMKAKKPVSFTINVDAEEMLWTDQKHFSHILENIIDNAIKYSADKAEVSISLKRDENFIVIAISDKGIGIERKIFIQYLISSIVFRMKTCMMSKVMDWGFITSNA